MSDVAIRVENLGKRYRIGQREPYRALRDVVTDAMYTPFRRLASFSQWSSMDGYDRRPKTDEWIWALKDVSFDVKRGEVVGIIGRNGAGKSTMLKILSRITKPTEGYAEIHGRVCSLLEVGTGFHRELSGRENIYLNGAILGMTRREIDMKFDEIVDFSGVEKFIDTPVKRYSSGMYVRLAFAVAAHVEPEILIVDEVLAVGDAAFQKKCLGKMQKVAGEGRTVLFVSHSMPAISALCPNSVLLKKGSIACSGQTSGVIKAYLKEMELPLAQSVAERKDREGNGTARITDMWIEDSEGQRSSIVGCGDKVSINLSYRANQACGSLRFVVSIYNDLDQRVLRFDSDITPVILDRWPVAGVVSCALSSPLPLCPGRYTANVSVSVLSTRADYVESALCFDVMEGDIFGTGRLPHQGEWPMFLTPHRWNLKELRVPK